jgi:endoglycosylceramidase
VDNKGDPRWKWLCDKIDDISFSWRQKDSERIGGGRFLTEFGASSDSKKAVEQLHLIMDASDKYFLSTAYWQFKHYDDPTTQASAGTQGFYDHQGKLQVEKVQVLSRAYARAICGNPRLMRYENGDLTLVYESKDCKGQPTEIYLNEEMNYPNGYDVKVEPYIARVVREKNLIKVYNDDFQGMMSVKVIKK